MAVKLTSHGAFGAGTAWPDVCIAVAKDLLALSGAWTVTRRGRAELRTAKTIPPIQPAQLVAVPVSGRR